MEDIEEVDDYDPPLLTCTNEEQRAVVRFLWSEGVKGPEIHRRLEDQYGHRSLPKTSIYQWMRMFKKGRTSVKDAVRSGRPPLNSIGKTPVKVTNNRKGTVHKVPSGLENIRETAVKGSQDNVREAIHEVPRIPDNTREAIGEAQKLPDSSREIVSEVLDKIKTENDSPKDPDSTTETVEELAEDEYLNPIFVKKEEPLW